MKKNVITVLLVLMTVGVLIFAYLYYGAMLLEKNTGSIHLYSRGMAICLCFVSILCFFSIKKKK